MATFQYSALLDGSSTAFNPAEVTGDGLNFDQTSILPYDVYLVRDENVGGNSSDDLSVAIIDGAQAGKHVFLLDIDAKQVTTSNFTFASGGSIFAGDNLSTTGGDDGANVQTGANFDNLFIGFGGNDSQTGGSSSDVFALYLGADGHYSGAGGDTIIGGGGIDTLRYLDQGAVGATVNLVTGLASGGDVDGTSNAHLTGIEFVAGTVLDDSLRGDAGANRLTGRDGDDLLRGAGGADTIEGGIGNDTIDGGGGGADWVDYQHAASGINIHMATGGSDGDGGTDVLSMVEYLVGSAYRDTVTGSSAANVLDMRGSVDIVHGGGGGDTIFGGKGNDKLYGDAGDDLLVGGVGSDVYFSGAGNDTMIGSGSSPFISDANATYGKDTFMAVSMTQGVDVIFAFDTDATGGLDATVDTISFVRLFNSLAYAGTTPFADGHLRVIDGAGGQGNEDVTDALVQVDANGGGDSWTTLYQIVDTSAATMMSNPDFFLSQ